MKAVKQAGLWVCVIVAVTTSAAAKSDVHTSQMSKIVSYATRLRSQLGPNIKHLSGAGRIVIDLGVQLEQLRAEAGAISGHQSDDTPASLGLRSPRTQMLPPPGVAVAAGKPVSTPDLSHTRFSGAVQRGSSIAWCGNKALVGFNDSDSFWQTGGLLAFFGINPGLTGQSLDGYATSSDGGRSFTDRGFPPAGPVETLMQGDPVVACSDPNTFFYASLYEDLNAATTGISLSRSTDGGDTFGRPVQAVAKDNTVHILDRPWMTADPTNIFITYTDFDTSGSAACGLNSRTAIELVKSADEGRTWSTPTVVVEVCSGTIVQGSQVIVDPVSGNLFVAWESFANDFYTREVDAASSTDGGQTFSPPVEVSKVDAVGDGNFSYGLQGFIKSFEYPSLAIGKGKNAGALYIVWNDGDNRIKDDWVSFISLVSHIGDGNYGFSDVFFSSSTDGGSTWSPPKIVNALSALPIDHFQPVVASDKTGKIAVCWYDRRRDKNNFLIDRECGKSSDGGSTWSNTRITTINYPSLGNQDLLSSFVSLGDEQDQLTSEVTNSRAGFLDGFVNTQTGNQNVQVNKF
jgi:hypothetical protein